MNEKKNGPGQAAPETPVRHVKKKRKKRWPVIVLAVLLIVCGVALWVKDRIRPPEQKPAEPVQDADTQQTEQPEPDEDAPASARGMREGVYTVMLIGQRDGNTDTLMAAMLDTEKRQMNVVSIPRDTVVAAQRRVPKINGAYNEGNGGEDGIEALMEEISGLIGYVPGNYACINMQGFIDLVDAIGGVRFDVPVRMYKPYEGINLKPGEQLLDGEDALALVRYRGYSSKLKDELGIDHDDYGRMQMQQMFLKALAEQTLTLDNIGKIPKFLEIANKNLTTDLDAGNLAWFAGKVKEIGTENLHFYTLPTVSVDYQGGEAAHGYYENILHDEAMTMLNAYLNPFDTPLTEAMVEHRILD